MFWKTLRLALLAGGILAATGMPVRADAEKEEPKAASDCTQYCTVMVKQWVPETYQCTRTTYRTECVEVPCTAYRWESVQEQRTRTVVCSRMVPETKTVCKTVCERVPCVETRNVTQTCVRYVNETKMVRKCVDRGHWECREVPCPPTLRDRLRGLLSRLHRHCKDKCDDSCNPCGDACGDCAEACVKTKTVKCWVPNPVWEECPVTCCRKVCETKCVPCQVTTYKTVSRQVQCQVTCYRCVKECKTENYTCCVRKCVPYQTTRKVSKCVPHCETVTCCRMVCKCVEQRVPVAPVCQPSCQTECQPSCATDCCKPARCRLARRCKPACESNCCEDSCGGGHRRLFGHRCSGGLGLRHEASCCN